MKTLLLTLTLLFSTQSFAEKGDLPMISTFGALAITASPFFSTSKLSDLVQNNLKEATQIIKDGQEYIQTGDMNLLLASKVNIIQQENPDMSDDEAVDVLLEVAAEIINK